jgi:hypothetical protein
VLHNYLRLEHIFFIVRRDVKIPEVVIALLSAAATKTEALLMS